MTHVERTYGFKDLQEALPQLSSITIKRGLARINIKRAQGTRKHIWDKKTFNFILGTFLCRLNYYLPEKQDVNSGTFAASYAAKGTMSLRAHPTDIRLKNIAKNLRNELKQNSRGNLHA